MVNELSSDSVVNYIAQESQDRVVALEGPPIYLWPHLPSQRWDNPAVQNGWQLTNDLHERLGDQARHWVLVDEYNYRPENPDTVDPLVRVEHITRAVPELGRLPVFASIPQDFSEGRGFCESDFLPEAARA